MKEEEIGVWEDRGEDGWGNVGSEGVACGGGDAGVHELAGG